MVRVHVRAPGSVHRRQEMNRAVRLLCGRPGNFESGLWCNSSISACEADGPGANPGFLTIYRTPTARKSLVALTG